MPPHDDKMYELVCNERFDKIDNKLTEISKTLKGTDGDSPGLCEQVRKVDGRCAELETAQIKRRKVFCWAGGIVIGGWLLDKVPFIVEWLKKTL